MIECDCRTLQQRIKALEQQQKELNENLHRLTNAVQAKLLKIELRSLGLETQPETERHDNTRLYITVVGQIR